MGRKREKLKASVQFLPFVFTFANGFLGFLSIVQSLEGNHIAATYCIIVATAMDLFDGRIARALNASSELGMELDSFCDAISFVVAPAVLLYSFLVHDFGLLGIIVLGIYLCAGLFRLAKFNITAEEQAESFIGLQTPIAAFFVTSVILSAQWLASSRLEFIFHKLWLMFFVVLIAYLMVSNIRFPAFKTGSVKYKKTYQLGLFIMFVSFCALFYGYPLFLLGLVLYVFFGIARTIYAAVTAS